MFILGLIDATRIRHLHVKHIIDSPRHRWVKVNDMILKDTVGQYLRVTDSRVNRWHLELSLIK